MSVVTENHGPKGPATVSDWKRIHQIKEHVLGQDPRSLRAEDYPEIRPEVLLSWKRSMMFNVDPLATDIPFDVNHCPNSKLAEVAQPIMNRLEDQISDLSAWAFLTDRSCRILTSVVGDSPRAKRKVDVDLRPGHCFTEEAIGTNGIGAAHEGQRAILISGSEHFRENAEILTTTGVIIRDPFTKRFVGTLGLHSFREYNLPAVLPWVVEIGRSIETQLASSRADSERELFEQFLQVQRRFRGAVVAMSKTLYLANAQARGLIADADEDLLRRIAEEWTVRPSAGAVRRRLSSGRDVSIRVTPVAQARGSFAAVLAVEPVASGTHIIGEPSFVKDEGLGENYRQHLQRALVSRQPVLLTGEGGSGKHYAAIEAMKSAVDVHKISSLDASVAHLDTGDWLRTCQRVLDDAEAGVVLRRIEELPQELRTSVANLVHQARALLIATTTEAVEDNTPTIFLRESFPVSVTIPALRERADEFAGICQRILGDLDPTIESSTLNPKALSALLADDWPGNVRQLRQVLATARIRAGLAEIRLNDLPSRFGNADPGRLLGQMERVERQTMSVALREAEGNRNVAAQRLGMSRATLYRKIKRYGLH